MLCMSLKPGDPTRSMPIGNHPPDSGTPVQRGVRTVPALTRVPRVDRPLTLSDAGCRLPTGALVTSITWWQSL